MIVALLILLAVSNLAWFLAWTYRGGTIRGLDRQIEGLEKMLTNWQMRGISAERSLADRDNALAAIRRDLGDDAVELMIREAA